MTPKADNADMNRCATCKHLGSAHPIGGITSDPDASQHRLCRRVPDSGRRYSKSRRTPAGDEHFDALACVVDRDEHLGKLVVLPTFGCVLWEER
jgi:hypothetical protein